jgi:hypothetical protein
MSLWAESATSAFAAARKGPGHLEAVERLKDWTRARFNLAEGDTLLVTEAARTLPGCPPLETWVAFWSEGGTRHHFKVFKAVEDVTEEDVPPAWLKASLGLSEGVQCACC